MPIDLRHDHSSGVTSVTLSGTLTRLDYRRVMPYLESIVVDCGKLNILLIFQNFEGWMPVELQGEAMSRLGELDDVHALAICAEEQWQVGLSSLLNCVSPSLGQMFPIEARSEASDWLVNAVRGSHKVSISAI